MSIFQISQKMLKNVKQYFFFPNYNLTMPEIENINILRENSDKCIILNHIAEKHTISQVDSNTLDVKIALACDLVFDFEINDIIDNLVDEKIGKRRYTSELICDDLVIHKNVENIRYENAFPVSSAGCNYIKVRIKFKEPINKKNIEFKYKYGLLPTEIGKQLKKLDIMEICERQRKKEKWVII